MHTTDMPTHTTIVDDMPTQSLPTDFLTDEPTRVTHIEDTPTLAPTFGDNATLNAPIADQPTHAAPQPPAILPRNHSRRRFLKIGAIGVGAAAVAGTGYVAARKLTHHSDSSTPQAVELAVRGQPVFEEVGGFPSPGQYLSRVYDSGYTFSALGTYWDVNSADPTKLGVEIRTSTNNADWTAWQSVVATPNEAKYDTAATRAHGALLLRGGRYMQFRVTIPAGMSLARFGLSPIAPADGPVQNDRPPLDEKAYSLTSAPYIISRAAWGADESLRFKNGVEVWPVERRTPLVMIVHHSETENVYNANPATDVRSIYYYHAVTKGWGDIGYNYLVDWKGNIYEGRYGGDGVVGGHAYQYNYGSIGICLIGSFKTVQPSQAQLASLIHLLAWKADTKSINPLAKRYFVDRANVACISGHRDVIDTTCPGDAAYGDLTSIRQQVAGGLTAPTQAPANVLQSVVFSPRTVAGGQVLRVDMTVKNTTGAVLKSAGQGPVPGYMYTEGQDFNSVGFPKQSEKYRVALDFTNNKGVSHPYRWGLGRDLQPNESITVTGYVRLTSTAVQNYWAALVQEYVRYVDDNKATTPISSLSSLPTLAATSQASANTWYFRETNHNLGGSFRSYWIANGGLAIFGFPITEEFTEISSTDGKAYKVQYFERARFEHHPDNAGTRFEVLLGLLGKQVTAGRTAASFARIASAPAGRDYYTETGHSLGGAFRAYWQSHGGLAQFGFPICEEFVEKNPEDGKSYTVQYFERARFEYHPEAPAAYQVMLGMLAKDILRQRDWLQ